MLRSDQNAGRSPVSAVSRQQRGGCLVLIVSAQRARAIQRQARIASLRRWQPRHQRLGLRIGTLGGEAGLGGRVMGRIQAGDLARGVRRIGQPRQALESRPLIVRHSDTTPPTQERCLPGRRVDGIDPGLTREGVGVVGAAGVGDSLGTAQHGGGQRRGRGALREHRGIVGVGGDGFLPPAIQDGLRGPVGIVLHEVGDLGSRGGAGRAKTQIQDELFRHRIGVTGGFRLRVGPPISLHRGQRIGILRPNAPGQQHRREQGNAGQNESNRNAHECFYQAQPCSASFTRLGSASSLQKAGSGEGQCSRDRSSR